MTTDGCTDIEPFAMISHADFTKAMELLGLDVEYLYSVSIGPFTDADEEQFPLTGMLRRNGAFWRVRSTVRMADPGLSDIKVRFAGILFPRAGERDED